MKNWSLWLLLATTAVQAQNPIDSLDASWIEACAGAAPGSALEARCSEILNEGPGSGGRRSNAAIGNQLNTVGAQAGVSGRSGSESTDGVVQRVEYGPLGLFAGLAIGSLERDATDLEAAYDTDSLNLSAGLDFRYSDMLTLGLALQWQDNDSQFAGDAGSLSVSGLGLLGFVDMQTGEQSALNAYLGYNSLNLDSQRNIRYDLVLNAGTAEESGLSFASVARGSSDSSQLAAGAQWHWQNQGVWNLGFHAGLHYLSNQVDAYTETGGDGLAFAYSAQDQTSFVSRLGVVLSRNVSTGGGALLPRLSLQYEHEFSDDARDVTARFAEDANGFAIRWQTESPDRDYLKLGVGFQFLAAGNNSFYLEYRTLLLHDYYDEGIWLLGGRIQL